MRHLYIAAGLVVGFLIVRTYLRRRATGAAPSSMSANSQTLMNWRLPWEIENTQETAIAAAVSAANRNVTGFTPGRP